MSSTFVVHDQSFPDRTLATPELSEWLTRHDADPMHMSPAGFGAFVVSEAERAAVLLSAP
jgi:hypothetical protein